MRTDSVISPHEAKSAQIAISLSCDGPILKGHPFRIGVPFARGVLRDPSQLTTTDQANRSVPLQSKILAKWADGSARSVLLDFQVVGDLPGESVFFLNTSEACAALEPGHGVKVAQRCAEVFVEVGARKWRFGPDDGPWGIAEDGASVGLSALLADGATLKATGIRTEVLDKGPVRAVIRTTGELVAKSSNAILSFTAESHFFADSSLRKVTLTVQNKRRAAHPGGIWELGDAGSVLISDLSIQLRPKDIASKVALSTGDGAPAVEASRIELFQASSGGVHWDSHNHVDQSGSVNLPFCGYRLIADDRESKGRRACPVARLESEQPMLALAVEKFWQNFPKAIRCDEYGLELGLFPRESAAPHELQGGEQKTHSLWMAEDEASAALLEGLTKSATPRLDPAYVAHTGAERFLSPIGDEHPTFREIVGQAVEGPSSLVAKRELIDEYGWRHFGDAYGDHEAAFHKGATPLVSHWNNQYDMIFGLGARFLASGDRRWLDLATDMVWHVIDIDIYHTDEDKAAYNHGLYWHTVHYIDAGKANHRSYPTGTVGGGPCAEHSYARGLRLFYYLTGEQAARDAVVELADWILEMEDGSATPFRFLAGGPTGLSSCSGNPDYHGPGRGPGNATETLLTAFEVTAERRYIDRVEELMRRVVHPNDDHNALNLLNAETRWYYTLYLQALGRYLEIKHEIGEYDRAYAYGRDTLLAYAEWMADNEYPYLQKPEILEFPTETWSAQDVRKSEVFHFAARHASAGSLQRIFLERAQYFFEHALGELQGDSRAMYTRPVALLLGSGFSYHGIRNGVGKLAGKGPDLSEKDRSSNRASFVPQKNRAICRLKAVVITCAAIGVVLTTAVTVLLLSK